YFQKKPGVLLGLKRELSSVLRRGSSVQVDEKTGSVRMAPILGVFDLKSQMEDNQFAAMPRDPSVDHVAVMRALALSAFTCSSTASRG
ncbi:MAG: hypothetical protein ACXVC4_20525, partial [Bdellovibrionota bacterium]